jgi:hypothetical protein
VVSGYDLLRATDSVVVGAGFARELSQVFGSDDDRLTAISLWTGSRVETADSALTLSILEDGDRLIRRIPIRAHDLAPDRWQRIAFEPIPDSRGKTFRLRLEAAGGAGALELRTNRRVKEECLADGRPSGRGALCRRTHYRRDTHAVYDRLLSRYVPQYPETTVRNREILHEILRHGLRREPRLLLHLVHLLDAFNRTHRVRRVLSLDGGTSHREAFLAARFPEIQIDAAEVGALRDGLDVANLHRLASDPACSPEEAGYDFVFAIDRIGSASDPREALRNVAAKARPGGWLYVAESFGSADGSPEAAAASGLAEPLRACRYEILLEALAFDARLTGALRDWMATLDPDTVEREREPFLELALLDLRSPGADLAVAGGVKILGRRSPARPS